MDLSTEQLLVKKRVEELIDSGCNYKLEKLETIYSKDLKIVLLSPSGDVMSFDYKQNMDFFKTKKENGNEPLNTFVIFNSIEVEKESAFVVVTRKINLTGEEQKIVFNLSLSKSSGEWKIIREFAVVMDNN